MNQTKSLIARIFYFTGVLLIMIFTLAIISLLTIRNQVSSVNDLHDSLLIKKALSGQRERISTHLKDYSEWNEAYAHLSNHVDKKWAWDDQNLGKSLYDNFGYDGVFVISADRETQYSVIDGALSVKDIDEWLDKKIKYELTLQVSLNRGKPTSQLIVSGSNLIVVAAAWIQSDSASPLTPSFPNTPSYMFFVQRLTPEKLYALGEEYGIQKLGLLTSSSEKSSDKQKIINVESDEQSVTLVWESEDPGYGIIKFQLPILIFAALITLLLTLIVIRYVLHKADSNDKNMLLLKKARLALLASELRFRDISEITSDWLWETDASLKIIWLSERFTSVTGYHSEEWIGHRLDEFFPEQKEAFAIWLKEPDSSSQFCFKNCRYASSHQAPRFCTIAAKRVTLPDGSPGIRGAATDVTQEVEAIRRVQFLSFHDELTGLPNRHKVKEILSGYLHIERSNSLPFAIICLDLDKFKPVNDIFGHAAGDKLLSEVSSRLRTCTRLSDLVARQGGDEFIIILADIEEINIVEDICNRISEELNRPFVIDGNEVFIGVSMGIAMYPLHSNTASDLLRYADIALYKAKESGRNNWVYYRHDMSEKISERRRMEKELKRAIRENQFFLVYQPRLNIKTSKVEAVEALLRWQHPERGIIYPDQFIPLAEDTGLIISLSDWVLNKACADAVGNLPGLSVSVNISAIEFQGSDLVSRVNNALTKSGLSPKKLELEVTENVTLKDPENTYQIMSKLKRIGVRFLIDDFGTGYASVSYLRKFDFDGIKLDKSFIFAMDNSIENKNVVEKVIGLGKAFKLEVTAEGVETEEQFNFLKKHHCDDVQGYYIGKPVDISQINVA